MDNKTQDVIVINKGNAEDSQYHLRSMFKILFRKAGDKERRSLLTVGEGGDIVLGVDFPFVADCRAINVCEHVIQKQILTDSI